MAVTLSVANEHASLPVAYRLHLPEVRAADPARRASAGVPEEVAFATEPGIAPGQIGRALADAVPPGVAVTDASYGDDTGFRDGVTGLGLPLRGRHPGDDEPAAARRGTAAGRAGAAPRSGRGATPATGRSRPGR